MMSEIIDKREKMTLDLARVTNELIFNEQQANLGAEQTTTPFSTFSAVITPLNASNGFENPGYLPDGGGGCVHRLVFLIHKIATSDVSCKDLRRANLSTAYVEKFRRRL
ncbi:hypothetical protein CVS40_2635 [Lucilia cuprina]|nr:hypothetical protein CVS40_2635 [Lucilia cuprina]